jgi:hypothetical protein
VTRILAAFVVLTILHYGNPAKRVLAGALPAPGIGTLLRFGGWITVTATFSYVLALGVASLLGSRGTTIGILLGWQLAMAPVLVVQFHVLGSLRAGWTPRPCSASNPTPSPPPPPRLRCRASPPLPCSPPGPDSP